LGKDKLRKWAEMEAFPFIFQPPLEDILNKDFRLKGRWRNEFFKNDFPLILELGCGKGEYTIGLARLFPEKNFLGVDIKGARMWKGATMAHHEQLRNVGFIRTRIEFIESFFDSAEVDEIWLTFPDPQLKRRRHKKRITGARFLNAYGSFLKPGGTIHLKTDSSELYQDVLALLTCNGIEPITATDDVYQGLLREDSLSIKTHYEQKFLKLGQKIRYIQFQLPLDTVIKECSVE